MDIRAGLVWREEASKGLAFLRSEQFYRERAAYMRGLAREALTEKLRASCLKSAEQFEYLAKMAAADVATGKTKSTA